MNRASQCVYTHWNHSENMFPSPPTRQPVSTPSTRHCENTSNQNSPHSHTSNQDWTRHRPTRADQRRSFATRGSSSTQRPRICNWPRNPEILVPSLCCVNFFDRTFQSNDINLVLAQNLSWLCTHTYMHARTHTFTHFHTYTHTHTHTHQHTNTPLEINV